VSRLSLRFVVAVAAAGSLAAGAAAFISAQAPEPQASFRAGVTVVQVDVTVLDDQRRPVRGLKASDFTVLEDGKPRGIVAFTPVDLPPRMTAGTGTPAWASQVASDVATNDLPPEGRLVVIAFDWSIRFDDSQTARKIAAAAINSLGPGDQAAVIYTSGFANAGVPQNFTSDHALLLRAVNQPMGFAVKGFDVVSSRVGGFTNQNGQMLEDPNGYTSGDCRCRACSLEAMTRVANGLRAVTGRRKLMIFIGTYFRGAEAAMQPARPAMRGLPPPPGSTTAFWIPDHEGPGTCNQPLKEAREKFERAAGLANLTVHVVDPVGLETLESSPLGGASPETIQVRQDSLHMPADMTGGRTVLNTNTPQDALPSILDESQAYYLLGFPASDSSSNRLHNIEVKVDRPGVHVRARSGYFGNEEAASAAAGSSPAPLARAVEGAVPRTDIPVSLVAVPFATPGKTTGTVALTLSVTSPAGGATARVEPVHLAIAALDPKGRVIASREASAEMRTGRSAGSAQQFEIHSRLDLAPGRYEIRVAADSPTGKRGSVFAFVDVPDFAKAAFSLTGVALAVTPARPSAPAGAFADLMPITPTTERSFAKEDRVSAFFKVQQGATSLQPVPVQIRIAASDGRIVFDETRSLAPADFATARAAPVSVDVPVSRLDAGEYLLIVQASIGSDQVRRNLRFSVR
jgi:VWFA-related protein